MEKITKYKRQCLEDDMIDIKQLINLNTTRLKEKNISDMEKFFLQEQVKQTMLVLNEIQNILKQAQEDENKEN